LKWREAEKTGALSPETWDLSRLGPDDPLFQEYPALKCPAGLEVPLPEAVEAVPLPDLLEEDALTYLLKQPIPDHLPDLLSPFNFEQRKVPQVSCSYFFTGPEDPESVWEAELVQKISQAKERIAFNQMYFHPTDRLLQAIADAASRGVTVTIITPTGGKAASKSEQFFGHRNIVSLHRLKQLTEKAARKNLRFLAYKQAKNGLHKKVVVVDDTVYGGSSNLGEKSLVLTGDHEMNFKAESAALANEVFDHFKADIHLSYRIRKLSPTLKNRCIAWIHHLGANIWG